MTGRIKGISGPTVSVDLKGLKLYEKVCRSFNAHRRGCAN